VSLQLTATLRQVRELEIPTAFHDMLKGVLNRRTLTDLRECSEFRREIKDHPAARFAEMLRQHLEREGWAIVDGFELRHDMRDEQFLTYRALANRRTTRTDSPIWSGRFGHSRVATETCRPRST